jgi:electron transport complex protein RnfG
MKIIKPALLSFACALLLVMTQTETASTIASNRQHHAEKLLREMTDDAQLERTEKGWQIYQEGRQIGTIRSAVTSDGYNGDIHFYLAATPDNRVISVRVTAHQETPGIGDGIDREVSDWIDQFDQRSLQGTSWQLRPEGDFDAMTGATITSRALVNAVQEALTE